MANYIDGFVIPVPHDQLDTYKQVVEKVAKIWKEHGALDYSEYVLDDPYLEGTRSFADAVNAEDDEAVIFGWVVFESREARDDANRRVAADSRMNDLIDPLALISRPTFDSQRMAFGGFSSLVHSPKERSA